MRESPGDVASTLPGGGALALPPDPDQFLQGGDPARLGFETRRSDRWRP
jgi:hypothetical protein